MTYTLEAGYGSKIVVPGAGFLLNNEMGDFNAAPGLTDERGLIGTKPNLARPGKRMLSSMAPTIIAKDGQLFMVTGTPGGRTIINTVLTTILNVIDYGMNAQEAVDAGRMHHQWLPDRTQPRALRLLRRHHQDAAGDGTHRHRRRQPGRRAGDRVQPEGQHARRRRRSAAAAAPGNRVQAVPGSVPRLGSKVRVPRFQRTVTANSADGQLEPSWTVDP